MPRNVEVCRCGSERRRLEALGYTFDSTPAHAGSQAPSAPRQPRERRGLLTALIGYEIDTDLSAGWRGTYKGLFVVAVVAVFGFTARFVHTHRQPVRGTVDVIVSLQDFTRSVDPNVKNAIPSFLASAGRVGSLPLTGTPTDPVRPIDEAELRQGFCSPRLATLVRYEYPGYYDDWSDEELEQVVLEKYPDYSDRLCMLSSRLDAGPGEVVKYEFKPRPPQSWALVGLSALLPTAVFALACLNVYYRVIVGRRAARRERDQGSRTNRNAA
ncbi:MAG TPA: hypothetical protein VFO58_04155 [Vicinamibacterales bacterium]|nr:hypothetical protein [Vicinamibacterales bacterium]